VETRIWNCREGEIAISVRNNTPPHQRGALGRPKPNSKKKNHSSEVQENPARGALRPRVKGKTVKEENGTKVYPGFRKGRKKLQLKGSNENKTNKIREGCTLSASMRNLQGQ